VRVQLRPSRMRPVMTSLRPGILVAQAISGPKRSGGALGSECAQHRLPARQVARGEARPPPSDEYPDHDRFFTDALSQGDALCAMPLRRVGVAPGESDQSQGAECRGAPVRRPRTGRRGRAAHDRRPRRRPGSPSSGSGWWSARRRSTMLAEGRFELLSTVSGCWRVRVAAGSSWPLSRGGTGVPGRRRSRRLPRRRARPRTPRPRHSGRAVDGGH
jgi:hypothetical protein